MFVNMVIFVNGHQCHQCHYCHHCRQCHRRHHCHPFIHLKNICQNGSSPNRGENAATKIETISFVKPSGRCPTIWREAMLGIGSENGYYCKNWYIKTLMEKIWPNLWNSLFKFPQFERRTSHQKGPKKYNAFKTSKLHGVPTPKINTCHMSFGGKIAESWPHVFTSYQYIQLHKFLHAGVLPSCCKTYKCIIMLAAEGSWNW